MSNDRLTDVDPALVDLVEVVDLFLTGNATRNEVRAAWHKANIVVHPDGPPLDASHDERVWNGLCNVSDKARPWWRKQTTVAT